jgi:hypothetical protein
MKLDSPLFDRIRVKPDQDRRPRKERPICEWPDCDNTGTHRAPKGRGHEREYYRFCIDHVREYNHSYNFFKGMTDDAVARYQKDALTGHLPTWKMGSMGGGNGGAPRRKVFADAADAEDPFEVFGEFRGPRPRPNGGIKRTVHNAARKALYALGLEAEADKLQIKARFKDLVKRHHPDANGGSTASQDKLREIIAAYNYLKSAGLC